MGERRVLITGAAGCVGRLLGAALAGREGVGRVLATDIRAPDEPVAGVEYSKLDILDPGLAELLGAEGIDTVVHLAAVVSPRPDQSREELHRIDVGGTEKLLSACVAAGVRRLVYTSSGAAYGYHPDGPALLREEHPLRGNKAFAYAHHKRLVEGLLARYRTDFPALDQVIFRVSTILGPSVHNRITALFERPLIIGVAKVDTPFCFVADEDVVACLVRAVLGGPAGIYNLTGDGVITLREIAAAMGRRYLALPPELLRRSLSWLHARGLSPYGPEQVVFLQYRPVLSNEALKRDFGYRPRRSSREVFAAYRQSRRGVL